MLFNNRRLILGTLTVCVFFYFLISHMDIGLSQKHGSARPPLQRKSVQKPAQKGGKDLFKSFSNYSTSEYSSSFYKKFHGEYLQSVPSRQSRNEINILIWTPYLNPKLDLWGHILQRLNNDQCYENRCRILYNKTQYLKADAVLYSGAFMNNNNNYQTPPTHPANQLWIYLSFEAQYSFKKNRAWQALQLSRVGFNWTMHFRVDSDIVTPYGTIKRIEGINDTKELIHPDLWSKKDVKKTVVWFVSHCKTFSARETYVEELKKHISVDIYGECGRFKCGGKNWEDRKDTWKLKECNDVINGYLFDLSFENSMCRDYVTEKFYRSLRLDVIPVVLGAADYTQIAPPHSYIDALDFPNPGDLADYLNQLASDPVAYNRYFEWKSHYTVDIGLPYSPMICGLCERLHQHRFENRTFELDLNKWFKNAGCHGSWKQFTKHRFRKDND